MFFTKNNRVLPYENVNYIYKYYKYFQKPATFKKLDLKMKKKVLQKKISF